MSKRNETGPPDAAAQRRAEALRRNLKRRKLQARARADRTASGESHDFAGFGPEIAPDKPKG